MNPVIGTLKKLIQLISVVVVCYVISACEASPPSPESVVPENVVSENVAPEDPTLEDASWQIESAHIKAMAPGQNRAAAYLVLRNLGQQDRQILGLQAGIAGHTEVHRHTYEDGMMKMRQVQHALVPAQGSLVFEPGGYHIMLLDVAEPPVVGSQFSVTIEFDGGERFTFPVDVRPL